MTNGRDYLLMRGDARRIPLADGSVHCVVTSPPYWSLRDYGTGHWEGGDPACEHRHVNARPDHSLGDLLGTRGGQGSAAAAASPMKGSCSRCGARRIDRQLGLEDSPADYVAAMVGVFREIRRVLRDDGTLWLNCGDGYNSSPPGNKDPMSKSGLHGAQNSACYRARLEETQQRQQEGRRLATGFKPKDLMGIPWMLAFALRDDGWYLRDPIVWAKAEVGEDLDVSGSVMPGSYEDRCTFAYEMVFMLSKSPRYYFDRSGVLGKSGSPLRNVWRINTEPSKARHYAAMPRELARRCIALGTGDKGCCPACRAPWRRRVEKVRMPTRSGPGSKVNGEDLAAIAGRPGEDVTGYRDPKQYVTTYRTVGWEPGCGCGAAGRAPCAVLDPFVGSGTTVESAVALGRRAIGLDLSPEYLALATRRLERPHAAPVRPAKTESLPLFDAHTFADPLMG